MNFFLHLPLNFCFDWEDISNTRDSVSLLSKRLEFRQKYSATHHIFNSLLRIWISRWNTGCLSCLKYISWNIWIYSAFFDGNYLTLLSGDSSFYCFFYSSNTLVMAVRNKQGKISSDSVKTAGNKLKLKFFLIAWRLIPA